jgi:hypothetical protein
MIARRNEIHKKKAGSLLTLAPNEPEPMPILSRPIFRFEPSYNPKIVLGGPQGGITDEALSNQTTSRGLNNSKK